ncbi:MAG TPA: NAD(P)/FAD-dependent oxidoreductase [Candidatus Angelobacter sp.]|nr:NAD(P)/FAD-dependent oxidoreductase [Candidatus Angelobacter sp.]
MDSCDILIAGGGPAGSSCAWALASSGLNVMVLDKARFPRDKVCGGWITPQVMQALAIDPDDYAQGRTLQPITGFRISSMGGHEVEVPFHQTVSYGIRRCEFDQYLLRRCGARVREGVALTGIERSGEGWLVNGEIKARLLVGAGGHFCPVARVLANGHKEEPVVAQEIEFAMTPDQAAQCGVHGEVPELFFSRDLKGYGWVFRKDNVLNVGLGRLDQRALPEHVGGFVRWLRASGKAPFDLPGRPCGHAYLLLGYSPRLLVADGALLIGDAAGLAYAPSGEGIRTAVESGLLAAQAIAQAGGAYRREQLQVYSALLESRFHTKPGQGQPLSWRLPQKVRNFAARLLLKSEFFCRHTVMERWFLHRHEPALAPLARPIVQG